MKVFAIETKRKLETIKYKKTEKITVLKKKKTILLDRIIAYAIFSGDLLVLGHFYQHIKPTWNFLFFLIFKSKLKQLNSIRAFLKHMDWWFIKLVQLTSLKAVSGATWL